ncbi:MAG TPA: MFS transporter [Jatrophihabitans sp.]|nr:MFS transporter [Jatrophihabitans sp.]
MPLNPGAEALIARVTPPDKSQRIFAEATLVTSIGTGLYSTGAVVFFVRSLHLSAAFVGTGLTIAAGAGLLSSLPAGRLADRGRPKNVLVYLMLVQAVLFAVFPLVRGRIAFLAVVVAVGLAQNATGPVRQVLISDLAAGGSRVAIAAYNRAVLNVGISLGALLAAVALALDSRAAYDSLLLGNAASFVAAGLLLHRVRVPAKTQPPPVEDTTEAPVTQAHPLRQPRFVAAAAICGVLFLSASVLDVALPLEVVQHTRAPRWMVAFLLLLNTVLAVALQVRASRRSETVSGAARANRRAGVALLGACLLFALASDRMTGVAIALLIVATVLLTAGELLSSAGAWGLSYGLAPNDQLGKYLASFGLLVEIIRVAGPALSAAVVAGGLTGWLLLGFGFLCSGLLAPLITGSRDNAGS